MFVRYLFAAIATVAIAFAAKEVLDETAFVPLEHPSIQYSQAPRSDRASKLANDLESGKVKLKSAKDGTGYLASLLEHLGIHPDSQTLVFSKTSFQASKISPRNPRALYFSDDEYVGYVRGSNLLEVASVDPKQGVIFYSFDQQADPPRLDRRDVCLQCHQSPGTLGVAGLMIASVFPDADGLPAFRGSQSLTDHRTSFQNRWGGWYVTGTHGGMRHIGNAVGHEPRHPEVLDTFNTQNQTSVEKKFGADGYLSPLSDIVALMTMEHQTRATNLMIRCGWEARIDDERNRVQLDADIESLIKYLIFADETTLRDTVAGVSTFTETFPKRGPRDSKGRSLRDFDLQTRMFRYPLSYMIYSDAFDAMPEGVRVRVYRGLYDVLTAKVQDPNLTKLTEDDRRNILEIVRETKPGLPAYWK
jgi:hypothetical protein